MAGNILLMSLIRTPLLFDRDGPQRQRNIEYLNKLNDTSSFIMHNYNTLLYRSLLQGLSHPQQLQLTCFDQSIWLVNPLNTKER